MSHEAVPDPRSRFEIGQRLDDTFATIRERLGIFVAISAVFAGLWVLPGWLVVFGAGDVTAWSRGRVDLFFGAVLVYETFLQTLVAGLFFSTAFDDPSRNVAWLPRYTSWTLRRIVPLYVFSFVAGLFVALGLLALVVPGLWALAAFSMVPIVLLVEDAGLGSFRRSLQLTEGYRASIAAFLMLMLLAVLVVGVALFALTAFVPPGLRNLATNFGFNLLGAFFCAANIAAYRHLRSIEADRAEA